MKSMKKEFNYKQIGKIAGILLAGIFLGWLFFGGSGGGETTDINQHIEETHTDEEGNVIYTCSMHPQIRQNEPGNCPICGMELIPVDEAEEQQDATFTMTEAAVKLADIQTTRVERRVPELEVRLPGRVAADERRVSSITAQFSGRIEELYVDFTGTYVKEGEKMAAIYSPELISAQRELLEAAANKQNNPTLYESARRKLRLWGLPENEIQRIEAFGEVSDQIPIVAPRSGYVTQKNIDVEDYVNEGTVMYKIADLSRLWVLFDAYETDIGAIDQGDSVEFTVRSHPGKQFKAKITYVDPFINPETRTARVRAEVENSDGTLKPDMLARGIVSGAADEGEKLMVPRSAVMWTGKRSIVFVRQQDSEVPSFEPRLVTLGQRAGDYYIIEEGVEEGEQVVTNGNFKLDSAAQLADELSMMNREPGSGGPPVHDHGDVEISPGNQEIETNSPTAQKPVNANFDTEEVPVEFREQLNRLVDNYLLVAEALTQDDLESSATHIENMSENLESINMNLINDDSQMQAWMTQRKILDKYINTISRSNNLDELRRQFALLSEALTESINTFGVERELYRYFCPMAQKEEGAYWISENEEISNPYMGQSMPGCGEFLEKIE